MDQPQSDNPNLFGGRYEVIAEDDHGIVEVLDHEPWRRCWACDSLANEAHESFCIDCGASLEKRTYRGSLMPREQRTGLALLPEIDDAFANAILPALWDQVDIDDRTLVLVKESQYEPVTLPLDEVVALRIGLALAKLLAILHNQGLVLGTLALDDLELTAAGQPRLHNVTGLHRSDLDEDAVQSDLQALAGLLEACTDTPRTTQRLDEDTVVLTGNDPDLAAILRDIRTGRLHTVEDLISELDDVLREHTRPIALYQRSGTDSNTGIVRDHNEDSLLALNLCMNNTSTDRSWGLYIVADGMGGHAAGEVASGLAIRGAAEVILREYLTPTLDLDADYDADRTRDIVQRAVRQANDYVLREARSRGNDMGTTLTMALVVGDRMTIANVGDSRTYLYRDGTLRRISKDHSLVMRLVELGQITEDDIYTHPQRNAVLRSLGDKEEVSVDLFSERLEPGDALLLCSDGQWEMTHDPEMERILAQHDDPQQACQQLITAANQAGGEDNITSVLVKFT